MSPEDVSVERLREVLAELDRRREAPRHNHSHRRTKFSIHLQPRLGKFARN
ncbi:unnamed protein product [Camellia sinensis]